MPGFPASSPTPPSPSPSLQFTDLPLEIHDLIWHHAAPAPRLFHFRHYHSLPDERPPPTTWRPEFYRFPRPPAITAICRSSRAAALRHGLFLLPAKSPARPVDPDSAVWFSVGSDVLYFDYGRLGHLWAAPRRVPGLERVQNLGLEWCGFLDWTVPVGAYAGEDYRSSWAFQLKLMCGKFPRMTSLHYVLPRTRREDGIRNEPHENFELEGKMMELPGGVMIPFLNQTASWEEVRAQVREAISHEEVERKVREGVGADVCYPPEVVGTWLLRDCVPSPSDDPSIRTSDNDDPSPWRMSHAAHT